jgi:anti-sigma B factor antagonist
VTIPPTNRGAAILPPAAAERPLTAFGILVIRWTLGVGMEIVIARTLADDGTAVVTVAGEIDFTNADEIAQGISDAVADWRPGLLRVDLAAASFIDSTGLGALIAGYRTVIDEGARFEVVNPSAGFLRVLTVTGLCELFGLVDHQRSDIAI